MSGYSTHIDTHSKKWTLKKVREFSSEIQDLKILGCANSAWGALIFTEIQIAENPRERLFCVIFSGASRQFLLISPSKNCRNTKISDTEMLIFRRFAPKILGCANSVRGALIFLEFSKSEYFWGALILNGKSPEMAGVR